MNSSTDVVNESYGWWTSTSLVGHGGEEVHRLVVRADQPGLGDRRPRLILEVGPVQLVQRPQATEIEWADALRHCVLVDVELADEQLAHLGRHSGVHLEADRSTEAPAPQLELHRGEQIVGLLFFEREVGVAGHAERELVLDDHAGEELIEMCGDHLLERNESLTVGHHHEAGQQRRHLDPREPPLGGDRIAEHDGQVQRERRDVRERDVQGRRRAGSAPGRCAARTRRPCTRGRPRRARAQLENRMPTSASSGARSSRNMCSSRSVSSATRLATAASCSDGVRPSGLSELIPATT